MQFITLRTKDRDGCFALLSSDRSRYLRLDHYPSFQSLIDHWHQAKDELKATAQALDENPRLGEAFDPKACHAPLPRAYQWLDGSAYVNHVELVRKARGAEMPASFWTDPLMYQGCSDSFLGPFDDIQGETSWGMDFEGEIGVITDDVPMGVSSEAALEHIIALVLINDISLRHLIPAELGKGFGFLQSKPASSFAPIALTPDALGTAWQEGKLHATMTVKLNDQVVGKLQTGEDMVFNFPQLIAHAAKTRNLCAGTIIGSGTISNTNQSAGIACLAEQYMLEIIHTGQSEKAYLQPGDQVEIHVSDNNGRDLFGPIAQSVRGS